MAKRILSVDWKTVDGAASRKRVLHLQANADGIFICPTKACLHVGFKSKRGLRKHINTSHPWYYHFDEQPVVDRNDAKVQLRDRLKCSTHKIPAFSLGTGVGYEFLEWLQTPCGGGKSRKEAVNIGRRAMKFLMSSLGEAEPGSNVKEDYIDCCVGSPSIVIKFLQVITEEWKLRSSGSLTYLKAISDLLDFRKAQGVSDDTLRSFTVTEVYLKRGKENLTKKKKIEYARNLDLETLISSNSWATIQEMEEVIPYHTPKYKYVLNKCKADDEHPTVSELCFATRFIVTFLFLRVKCTRPMSYQFMTMDMFRIAKENGGFIDQTLFKTTDKYMFDTLILTSDVISILDTYVETIRPLLVPTCDYVVLTTNGTQYKALGAAMSLLVFQAIGKSINPTRYRQIVETESAVHLTVQERETISKDQKHSSYVAKRSYQKQLSRQVALEGMACMQKIVGVARDQHTKTLASSIVVAHEANDAPGPSNVLNTCSPLSTRITSPCTSLGSVHVSSDCERDVPKRSIANNVHTPSSVPSTPVDITDRFDAGVILLHSSTDCEEKVVSTDSEEDVSTMSISQDVQIPSSLPSIPVDETHHSAAVHSLVHSSTNCEEKALPGCLPSYVVETSDVSHAIVVDTTPSSSTMDTNVGETIDSTTNIEELEIKKEELEKELLDKGTRLKRFSIEEDNCLKQGIAKYGVGKWVQILKDKCFTFHSSRTRDSLRVRADTLGISKKKNGRKKYNIRKL